ncbi:hypothetical protein K7G98_41165, partial [Saccharothrix sp. MB29]|nr:hypothetical protein [Saccharothrix sp. MB29]
VVLRGTGVLTALCAFFDHAWEPATDLGVPVNRDVDGLTAPGHQGQRRLAEALPVLRPAAGGGRVPRVVE